MTQYNRILIASEVQTTSFSKEINKGNLCVNIELNYWSECINCKIAFAVCNKVYSLLQEEIQRNSTAKK